MNSSPTLPGEELDMATFSSLMDEFAKIYLLQKNNDWRDRRNYTLFWTRFDEELPPWQRLSRENLIDYMPIDRYCLVLWESAHCRLQKVVCRCFWRLQQ